MAGSMFDLTSAREIAREAVELVESDAALDENGWEAWLGGFETFMECESAETCCKVEMLRYALEEVIGQNQPADLCIAALKLALSAFIVVGANPYFPAGYRRSGITDTDVEVLVRQAQFLLDSAKRFDPSPFPITRNSAVVGKVQREQKREWLQELVKTAVRPGDAEGAEGWDPNQN